MVAQNITLHVGGDPAEWEQVIVRFLKDYFGGARVSRAVVGLSGGIDSAVSAALGVRALGKESVVGLVLPTENTSDTDMADAKAVADAVGIEHRVVDVQPVLDALDATDPGFTRETRGNAAARLRMVILHEHAYREKALVLGTGNKSEIQLGYHTKFGDGGVDVQPIGDLYKTQVRALAEQLNVPEAVRRKTPSAGLWEGQTDEGDLGMTYEVLDRVLLGLEVRLPHATIAEALEIPRAEVERIARIRSTSQHKRRMPMAPKFGLRTAGVDWREATYG